HYLAAAPAEGVLRTRLGEIDLQTLRYGEVVDHFGVRLSLHPAGHVLGSAQVRLEHAGRVWGASGEYSVARSHALAGGGTQTCAPHGGAPRSTAASFSATTPTGRACSARSPRPAPSAPSSPTATRRSWCAG